MDYRLLKKLIYTPGVQPKEREHRFHVDDVPACLHAPRLLERDFPHVDAFVFVQLLRAGMQASGRIQVHALGAVARRRIDRTQEFQGIGEVAGFLTKFAVGAVFTRFIALGGARRYLP